jgi:hypothetical protein
MVFVVLIRQKFVLGISEHKIKGVYKIGRKEFGK